MMDSSWDIATHQKDIQRAYARLQSKYPSLGPLSAGPYTKVISRDIHTDIHHLITRYPVEFPCIVDTILQDSAPSETPTNSQKRSLAFVDPIIKLSSQLKAHLARCDAAEAASPEEDLGQYFAQELESDEDVEDVEDAEETEPVEGLDHEHLDERMEGPSGGYDEVGDDYESCPRSSWPYDIDGSPGQTEVSTADRTTVSVQVTPKKRISDECSSSNRVKHPRIDPDPAVPTETRRSLFQTFSLGFFGRGSQTMQQQKSTTSTSSSSSGAMSVDTVSTASTLLTNPALSVESSQTPRSESMWTPKPALPAGERAVYMVRPHPYSAVTVKLRVVYGVQWEFERLLDSHPTLSWDDVIMADIAKLEGRHVEVIPALPGIIRDISARKMGIHAGAAHEGVTKPLDGDSTRARKIRMLETLDREELSILETAAGLSTATDCGNVSFTMSIKPDKLGTGLTYVDAPQTVTPPKTRSQVAAAATPAKLIDDPENPMGSHHKTAKFRTRGPADFSMTLRPLEMPGKSFRLARRFGSRRVITVKYDPKDFPLPPVKDNGKITRLDLALLFFGRMFILLGHTFMALWAKPDGDSIFLVEVGDSVPGIPKQRLNMPTFSELLSMYNCPEAKSSQAMAKWASRKQLLFSDTVPGALLDRSAITIIPDIVTRAAKIRVGGARTEEILTDGCGLLSRSLARTLAVNPQVVMDGEMPCVIQLRIGGSKGLLAIMSEDQELEYPNKDIVLRESMVKAHSAPGHKYDPSLLTLDVVRSGFFKKGCTLSAEPIMVMQHCGVPRGVFLALAQLSIEELKMAFDPQSAEGERRIDTLIRLVKHAHGPGGAATQARQRECTALGRSTKVAGLALSHMDEADGDVSGGDLISEKERFDIDPISGQPGSIGESFMRALQCGFDPLESYYTANKLHHLVEVLSTALSKNLSIPLDKGLSAFIIPDPFGVLAPDEIHCYFPNHPIKDPVTLTPIIQLEGDVLVYRSPCKLPTDVRKMKAVRKDKLLHLRNCIVMSANSDRCTRSPASILGGGDYDGDTVNVIWEPSLVDSFTNADLSHADLPDDFEAENFDKEVVKVEELVQAVELAGGDEGMLALNQQTFLLGAMMDDRSTGNYSDLHTNSVYTRGFDHPETIRLARMFCLVLDARKSGLRVKARVKAADSRQYGGCVPWKQHKKGLTNSFELRELKRPSRLGSFIMDDLIEHARQQHIQLMRHFPLPSKSESLLSMADYDALTRPLVEAQTSALRSAVGDSQLAKLRKHCNACYKTWKLVKYRRLATPAMVVESYAHNLAGHDGIGPMSPRKNLHRTHSNFELEDLKADLLMLTQLRVLATIWRDRFTVAEASQIPNASHGGGTGLKELKVACGANCEPRKHKQEFVFDMDFDTTCALKAQSSGAVTVILKDVTASMRPGR